jgi:hypothetical protein
MQIRVFTNGKTNAKSVRKASIPLAIAAIFFSAAFANAKGTDKRISFQGYLQGHETDVLQGTPPEAISVDGSVTGIATHLNQFTLTYKVMVKLPEGSATGSAELIAANGDRIYTSIVGQGEPTDTDTPDLNSIVEIHLITGGSGQFAGARGSFTIRRLVDLATGFTSGSLRGTLSLAGPRRGDR